MGGHRSHILTKARGEISLTCAFESELHDALGSTDMELSKTRKNELIYIEEVITLSFIKKRDSDKSNKNILRRILREEWSKLQKE